VPLGAGSTHPMAAHDSGDGSLAGAQGGTLGWAPSAVGRFKRDLSRPSHDYETCIRRPAYAKGLQARWQCHDGAPAKCPLLP
jgi:hypothetical protein